MGDGRVAGRGQDPSRATRRLKRAGRIAGAFGRFLVAMRVAVGAAAFAAIAGSSEPSVSRATICAWCADHSVSARWPSARQAEIDTTHSSSQVAVSMPMSAATAKAAPTPCVTAFRISSRLK